MGAMVIELASHSNENAIVERIRSYWDSHTLGCQYVTDPNVREGTVEYFDHIQPWMNPYKFPWIMDRIEREARLLQGKRLLEIGCGMGYDSAEFIKRGVRVTATDLTPNAIKFAQRHFDLKGYEAEELRVASALDLPFEDESFDAVWSNGVFHATGHTARAVSEAYRVLKPGGRAIISHFYRKPSWMYLIHRAGRENIEFTDQDPPVNEFYRDEEILAFFRDFDVIEAAHEHHRALPVCRTGLKATLYRHVFMPTFNLIPESLAKRWAYKLSVTAIKR
jgi:ubiquinone/menaquinone biosynthesis C-methylase UbiE